MMTKMTAQNSEVDQNQKRKRTNLEEDHVTHRRAKEALEEKDHPGGIETIGGETIEAETETGQFLNFKSYQNNLV